MNHVIDTSEVVGSVEMPEGTSEVCVSAVANFDENSGRLVVKLESFLRLTDLLVQERHFRASWLPANETVTESVDREECHALARDIFNSWVRRVREATPQLHGL